MKNNIKEPKILTRIIRFLAIDQEQQSIVGDFEEEYLLLAEKEGKLKAIRWYIIQILISILPFVKTVIRNNIGMVKSYIKLARRSIVRNKLASVINIFGFSTALATCLLSFVLIYNIVYSDNFHENYDSIYMALSSSAVENGLEITGQSPAPLAVSLSDEYPQIEKFSRYDNINASVEYRGNYFDEDLLKVDRAFFDIFTFPFTMGSRSGLEENYWIVLSDRAANKYFGIVDPIGKQLMVKFPDGSVISHVVTGVLDEVSLFSSIQPNIIIAFETSTPDTELLDWTKPIRAAFFEISDKKNVPAIRNGAQKYVDLVNADDPDKKLKNISVMSLEEIQNHDEKIRRSEFRPIPAANYIGNVFTGILILLSACFNYINMSLHGVNRRTVEIGLRKVIGANRKQLIFQFIAENIVLITFSMILGLFLCEFLFLPGLSSLFGSGVHLSLLKTDIVRIAIFVAGMIVFTGLAAGIYPAIIASRLNPSQIFKHGKIKKKRNIFAKASLSFQYILAFVTIVFTIAMFQNNTYLKNIDWGYDKDNMIVIPVASEKEYDLLENLIRDNESITAIVGSVNNLGTGIIKTEIEIDQKKFNIGRYEIGSGYVEALGLNLKHGRSFQTGMAGNTKTSIIVNETLVNEMEWKDALGKTMTIDGELLHVIGVVGDFHYEGFDRKIDPVFLKETSKENFNFMTVKVKDGSIEQTYNAIEKAWNQMLPEIEFAGVFQDRIYDTYQSSINADWRGFLVISIIILTTTCMGLLGLMSMNISRREKEMGVRKVLGASEKKLFMLLNIDFLIIMLVSFIIATPLSKYLLESLFTLFPYHVPVSTSMFTFTYLLISITAIGIILNRVIKAVTANPVDILKNE